MVLYLSRLLEVWEYKSCPRLYQPINGNLHVHCLFTIAFLALHLMYSVPCPNLFMYRCKLCSLTYLLSCPVLSKYYQDCSKPCKTGAVQLSGKGVSLLGGSRGHGGCPPGPPGNFENLFA